ncbi:MAG: hypothetical protein JW832_01080, partial [Deltaproteobacteria bacterium]|nr:hypothetical protein [Deltaproteobacteria bacterium]
KFIGELQMSIEGINKPYKACWRFVLRAGKSVITMGTGEYIYLKIRRPTLRRAFVRAVEEAVFRGVQKDRSACKAGTPTRY